MATEVELPAACPDEEEDDEDGWERTRSPRIIASGWMTDFPPSMMFWVPTRMAFRATLFPVSWRGNVSISQQSHDGFSR